MELDIRVTPEDQLRQAADAMRTALLFQPTGDKDWEELGWGWREDAISVSAWEGERCVGNAGSMSFRTLVPGGRWLPTAGLTRVGVVPTHTRRGALSRMLRKVLEEERAAGKVLSSLRASEAVIYRRFGYGLANHAVSARIDPRRILPLHGTATGSFRIVPRDEVLDTAKAVYASLPHRVGAIDRTAFLWSRYYDDTVKGEKASYLAVHTSPDGVDDGLVQYDVKWTEREFAENHGTAAVFDLFGATPAVELALWQYVANVSLVREITCESRPDDDLLRLAAADVRGYQVAQRWDEQWIRPLDVEACLAGRTYASDDTVTIAVKDPWFADNEATFRVAPDGVRRVDTTADLTATVDALGSAYMGSVRWADLAASGRVEGSADAIAAADRLFTHRPGTWCGSFF